MGGEYLLDTNVIIAFLGGDNEIGSKIKESEKLFASVIVLGELLYGVANSSKPKENAEKVFEFMKFCEILEITKETSKRYAEVKTNLRRKGKPIPENDIWIASSALEHGLIVATQDEHFMEVDFLKVEKW